MNDADTRFYEMFLSVHGFNTTQSERIPPRTLAHDLFANLTRIISELDRHTATQVSGKRAAQESTTSKAAARAELYYDLDAIRRTARAASYTIPGLEDKFRFSTRMKDQDLLATARAFLADAEPYKDEFIRRGLPANFLDDLRADIAAFEQAITRKLRGRETHVTSSAAIDDLIDEGVRTVRELDPIMRNMFAAEPAILAAWLSAIHVERPPRRSKNKKTPTPPPPPSKPSA
ncbi:MAG TPA: hypothetical protein VF658_15455 [Pyrinomonadaceae bacterium]|jgi:hypothetical protein